MKRRIWLAGLGTAIVAVAVAVSLTLVVGAHAAPPSSHPAPGSSWKVFGDAEWTNGAGNVSKFGLVTTSSCSTCPGDFSSLTYGGIDLVRLPTADPTQITALSFDFNANQTGASGGSPRLNVNFSDGGNASLRPLSWTAGQWTTIDGMSGTNWDNNYGGCGYLYGKTWSDIVTCHAGATISDINAVNDSGWVYHTTSEQVVLDNITVNNAVATGPGNNS